MKFRENTLLAFKNSVQLEIGCAFQIVFAFENSVHDSQWIKYSTVFALMSVMQAEGGRGAARGGREIEDYVLDSTIA